MCAPRMTVGKKKSRKTSKIRKRLILRKTSNCRNVVKMCKNVIAEKVHPLFFLGSAVVKSEVRMCKNVSFT